MFDINDFYPTKESTARKMIEKLPVEWKRKYKYILEPTVGKGDLIESYIKFYSEGRDYKGYWLKGNDPKDLIIDVIEIDENLASLIRGKGYNLVFNDFLNYEPQKYYDLILANFPFSIAEHCMLKAIEIQERIGGDIIAITSASIIKNPFSSARRKLVQLLEKYNADVEFLEDEFVDAERKTDVEIAIIHITIPMVKTESMFEREFKRDNPDVDFQGFNALIPKMNKLQQLVFEYDLVIKATTKLFEEKMRVSKLLGDFGLTSGISICNDLARPQNITINDFIEDTNKKFWDKFISETNFETRLPSSLKDNFRANMQKQKNIAFNMDNVQYFYNELVKAIPRSYESTIADLFDKLTREYNYTKSEYNKNIHYYNSWITNDAFAIGKKVIIPCSLANPNCFTYSLPNDLLDLNIAFNNIEGVRPEEDEFKYQGDIYNAIKNNEKKIETSNFYISTYKRGTMHIEFKNPKAVAMFNLLAGKGKNWLPGDFENKPYNEMTKEEQETVKALGFEVKDFEELQLQSNKNDYLKLLA